MPRTRGRPVSVIALMRDLGRRYEAADAPITEAFPQALTSDTKSANGYPSLVYRWPWLERQLRLRPALNLVVLIGFLLGCIAIVVFAGSDDSPRSGLPMWVVGLLGIGAFSWATAQAVVKMRKDRRSGT